MNLKPINLINTFPKLTPMEENQTNLEVTITMLMIVGQLAQEKQEEVVPPPILIRTTSWQASFT